MRAKPRDIDYWTGRRTLRRVRSPSGRHDSRGFAPMRRSYKLTEGGHADVRTRQSLTRQRAEETGWRPCERLFRLQEFLERANIVTLRTFRKRTYL